MADTNRNLDQYLIDRNIHIFPKSGIIQSTDSSFVRLAALPLGFFTPDTKWGYGASGLLTFSKSIQNPNQLNFAVAYTQLKQLLTYLNYQLYSRDEKYWIFGELGYYDYVYNFLGIGNANEDPFRKNMMPGFPELGLLS